MIRKAPTKQHKGERAAMQSFKEIEARWMAGNLFEMIGDRWMLIAAKKGDKVNMMTASWGGAGVLWGRPVVFAFIRPQRFTKELVDASEGFSCTFFPPEYKAQLSLCGSKSGRDVDKVEACDFHVLEDGGVPYFAQADTAILCQKLYHQPLDPAGFIADGIDKDHYPHKDYHHLYVGEIRKLLVKE